jgi:hypothetical protein
MVQGKVTSLSLLMSLNSSRSQQNPCPVHVGKQGRCVSSQAAACVVLKLYALWCISVHIWFIQEVSVVAHVCRSAHGVTLLSHALLCKGLRVGREDGGPQPRPRHRTHQCSIFIAAS